MNNKTLVGIIVALALVIVFETAYVMNVKNGVRIRAPILRQHRQMLMPKFSDDYIQDFSNIQNWEPLKEMERIQQRMDKMFRDSFARAFKDEKSDFFGKTVTFEPNVGIKEANTEYIVTVDLPGMNKDDIKIEVKDNLLVISGERKSEIKTENEKIHKEERSYGYFSRTLTLPPDVRTDELSAEYKNGVLNISIPRAGSAQKSEEPGRKIQIR